MSGGTRSAVFRNRDHDRNQNDDEPPPPPSAVEIMMEAERNRRDQTRLLELIEQNTAHHRNVVVSIRDFILLKPPVFRCSSETGTRRAPPRQARAPPCRARAHPPRRSRYSTCSSSSGTTPSVGL